jgi:hypothetical protein
MFFNRHANTSPSPNSRNIDHNEVAGGDEDLVDTATSSTSAFFSVHLEENFASISEATNGSEMETSVYNFDASISKLDSSAYYRDGNVAVDSLSARSPEWTNWQEPSLSFSDHNDAVEDNAQGELAVATTSQILTAANEDVQMTSVSDDNIKTDAEKVGEDKNSEQLPVNNHTQVLFSEEIQGSRVQIEGSMKAVDHQVQEGDGVDEPGAVLHEPKDRTHGEDTAGDANFTDVNYWRTHYDNSKADLDSP